MKLETLARPSYNAIFESWDEFVAFGKDAPLTNKGSYEHSRVTCYCRGNDHASNDCFTQTRNFDEAYKLATDGWKEGSDIVKRVGLKEFEAISNRIERPNYVFDVEGSDVDVARLLSGEPEVWARQEMIQTDGPGRRIFHVMLNCAISALCDSSVILMRGAAITALVNCMEMAGHGVKVTLISTGNAGFGTSYSKDRYYIQVPLKSEDQPLDLDRLAFALAHPSTSRRFKFAAMERLPYFDAYQNHYGSPTNPEEPDCDIYMGSASILDRNWNNETVAGNWIADTLKSQGIVLRDIE